MDTEQKIEPVEGTPATPVTPALNEQVATATTATMAAPALFKNKQLLVAVAIALLVVLGAGYFAYTQYYVGGGVAAVVNGKKIYMNEFNDSVALIEQTAAQQGIDTTDPAAKKGMTDQAMEVLVSNALLITAAEKAGFAADGAAIQEKYDELVTQLGDEATLKARMTEIGLTEEKLRLNIADRILADQYIESETTIAALTVAPEEVDAFLKSIDTGEAVLPPIDEIRPQIEAELLSQKQQQIVTDLIEKLRGEASIVIKI